MKMSYERVNDIGPIYYIPAGPSWLEGYYEITSYNEEPEVVSDRTEAE